MTRSSAAILALTVVAAVAVAIAQTDPAPSGPEAGNGQRRELREALEKGDRELAAKLLEDGADPAAAILDATRREDLEALRWLFDRGVVADGRVGARALVSASRSETPELAGLLRAHGADLDDADPAGMTLLMSMAAGGANDKRAFRLISSLVEAGADVDRKSLAGRTALFFAVKLDRFKVVRLLIGAGADVDPRDRDGWTPLMLAARDGHLRSVVKLLEAGADPNTRSTLGWTPLMWAARYGRLAVAEELLAAGADPNASSYVGGTALIRAVQGGWRHVVWALLAAGARQDAELGGLPAVDWARAAERRQLVRLLKRGAGR